MYFWNCQLTLPFKLFFHMTRTNYRDIRDMSTRCRQVSRWMLLRLTKHDILYSLKVNNPPKNIAQ